MNFWSNEIRNRVVFVYLNPSSARDGHVIRGAGAFGARAARIKTRISYVHRISSYRRCARPWAFTNMSGETPYFDLFFVSIRSARRGSTSKIPVYMISIHIYHIISYLHSFVHLSQLDENDSEALEIAKTGKSINCFNNDMISYNQ